MGSTWHLRVEKVAETLHRRHVTFFLIATAVVMVVTLWGL
jgi:hypothetical protein